uniref:Ankyrin repeat and SOCS box containing 5 n=1 Tax=Laticauda laticaudata TaxID=8630 RepID=A0A8C5SC13_LATLA
IDQKGQQFSGSASCVQLLLEYGAKIQWETCFPSPTHEAASRGHSDCLQLLISWGIEVDLYVPHLGTPLYVACFSQQKQCVHKLLHSGANVQKGKFLETPLHAAARLPNTEIVNMLLEFGANINAKNSEFERPVDVAVSSSLVEKILLLHEGKVCICSFFVAIEFWMAASHPSCFFFSFSFPSSFSFSVLRKHIY